MAAGSRSATGPKPPEPGVIMSMTEPAGAANAPLLGRWRVAPSGVVSVTTAAAPALPPSRPNGGEVIRSMHSAPGRIGALQHAPDRVRRRSRHDSGRRRPSPD